MLAVRFVRILPAACLWSLFDRVAGGLLAPTSVAFDAILVGVISLHVWPPSHTSAGVRDALVFRPASWLEGVGVGLRSRQRDARAAGASASLSVGVRLGGVPEIGASAATWPRGRCPERLVSGAPVWVGPAASPSRPSVEASIRHEPLFAALEPVIPGWLPGQDCDARPAAAHPLRCSRRSPTCLCCVARHRRGPVLPTRVGLSSSKSRRHQGCKLPKPGRGQLSAHSTCRP